MPPHPQFQHPARSSLGRCGRSLRRFAARFSCAHRRRHDGALSFVVQPPLTRVAHLRGNRPLKMSRRRIGPSHQGQLVTNGIWKQRCSAVPSLTCPISPFFPSVWSARPSLIRSDTQVPRLGIIELDVPVTDPVASIVGQGTSVFRNHEALNELPDRSRHAASMTQHRCIAELRNFHNQVRPKTFQIDPLTVQKARF